MSMKRTAQVQTALFFSKAAEAFKHHPTATNWSLLNHAMLAHQYASCTKERELVKLLINVKSEDIVDTLAMQQHLEIDHLNNEIAEGRARVIDESYFRRPAAPKASVVTESMINETVDRSH